MLDILQEINYMFNSLWNIENSRANMICKIEWHILQWFSKPINTYEKMTRSKDDNKMDGDQTYILS